MSALPTATLKNSAFNLVRAGMYPSITEGNEDYAKTKEIASLCLEYVKDIHRFSSPSEFIQYVRVWDVVRVPSQTLLIIENIAEMLEILAIDHITQYQDRVQEADSVLNLMLAVLGKRAVFRSDEAREFSENGIEIDATGIQLKADEDWVLSTEVSNVWLQAKQFFQLMEKLSQREIAFLPDQRLNFLGIRPAQKVVTNISDTINSFSQYATSGYQVHWDFGTVPVVDLSTGSVAIHSSVRQNYISISGPNGMTVRLLPVNPSTAAVTQRK